MIVHTVNSRNVYVQLQAACPDRNAKSFSPILSLPSTIIERHELVLQWNRSLHLPLQRIQSSLDDLNMTLKKQLITVICSNPNYSIKSYRCIQIDKQVTG